ncbi:hypothetical protein CPB84DRAFT_1797410 [Gymnopilus junonius]|uniref:Uncharacterized protein n=1 Tax=Gymnopilus junonius TaxID=109634 RepID=A0A9P5N8F3_GYMJU|nr:hypothetical protein CPB84DRAFT_1797410 [Gymnopilus junonius]
MWTIFTPLRTNVVFSELARNMEPLSFSTLHAEVAPRAESMSFRSLSLTYLLKKYQASVPLAVKREISSLIRQHLEKQFE